MSLHDHTDLESVHRRLEALKVEHRDLDDAIRALEIAPGFNQIQVQRMKKRKLAIKDQILHLEGLLIPDIIA